jgi:post-segregation antitoxin (ccd killing protein)
MKARKNVMITIDLDQYTYLQRKHINISSLVRDLLDREISQMRRLDIVYLERAQKPGTRGC